tara:strand:+ start:615 stop:1541 length:927 start_codon:yes stop_codon:yes gene_type:complete
MLPLMPKATAVWLVENTALSFQQIGEFCGLHPLEIQGIADEEVAIGIQGLDPITHSQLTREQIAACEADPKSRLTLAEPRVKLPNKRPKGPRYTPVSKRQDRPNAIAWLLRYHPEVNDTQVSRIVGTTKPTINSVRDRTHWNIQNIRPQDPVSLGLCNQTDLDEAVNKAQERLRKRQAKDSRSKKREQPSTPPPDKKPENVVQLMVENPISETPFSNDTSPTRESVFGDSSDELSENHEKPDASEPTPDDVFTPTTNPTETSPKSEGPVEEPPNRSDDDRATLGSIWPDNRSTTTPSDDSQITKEPND